MKWAIAVVACGVGVLVVGCQGPAEAPGPADELTGVVAHLPSRAQSADGQYISWREHLIDDEAISGVPLRGSDGLVLGDLDRDGIEDIVSVHESDTTYDGVPDGHIRLAFGADDPDDWELVTLAEGEEAGAAEDVAVADLDGDGYLDVIASCELAHLIYFRNPGEHARHARWQRVIPEVMLDRGSFIRVFFADFDDDGRPEVVTPNKGEQNPALDTPEKNPISWFEIAGGPLDGSQWIEHELIRVRIPINSEPVDLDGDGDLDIVGGSRGEFRIFWFENRTTDEIAFEQHDIRIAGTSAPPGAPRPEGAEGAVVTGFNMSYVDLSGDGRRDIVLVESRYYLVWLEQPADPTDEWQLHAIGDIRPDHLVGFAVADIDGDGDADVITGAYSRGPRDRDGEEVGLSDPLGRIAWFENPGDSGGAWTRHDISRRKRGMYDKFIARDLDGDGDVDFLGTRGNSAPYDGVFWLEQVRSAEPEIVFRPARETDSEQMALP